MGREKKKQKITNRIMGKRGKLKYKTVKIPVNLIIEMRKK